MSFLSKPTSDGIYRIKLLDQNRYIVNDRSSNPGLRLASLDPDNKKQKACISSCYYNLTSHSGTVEIISSFGEEQHLDDRQRG